MRRGQHSLTLRPTGWLEGIEKGGGIIRLEIISTKAQRSISDLRGESWKGKWTWAMELIPFSLILYFIVIVLVSCIIIRYHWRLVLHIYCLVIHIYCLLFIFSSSAICEVVVLSSEGSPPAIRVNKGCGPYFRLRHSERVNYFIDSLRKDKKARILSFKANDACNEVKGRDPK